MKQSHLPQNYRVRIVSHITFRLHSSSCNRNEIRKVGSSLAMLGTMTVLGFSGYISSFQLERVRSRLSMKIPSMAKHRVIKKSISPPLARELHGTLTTNSFNYCEECQVQSLAYNLRTKEVLVYVRLAFHPVRLSVKRSARQVTCRLIIYTRNLKARCTTFSS